jgi:hypothetical protein
MDKQQVLSELKQLAQSGQISQAEVLAAFSGIATPGFIAEKPIENRLKLSEIMYYIGGAIVFLGICVMVYQNWDSFDSFLRIFVTLGSGIAAFVVGALLYRYENLRKVSQAFFLLAGLLAPLAMNVAFKESGLDLNSDSLQLLIYLILTAVFLGGLWFFRQQTILLFFGVLFATAIFHFVVNLMVGESLLMANYSKFWEYRILVEGLAWILLGYYLTQTPFTALTGVMYGFGCLGFLGAAIALGGWTPDQNVFWELIYPLLVFGIIFLSVYVKSKAFLTFGTIFLIGYILKLTSEYFSSGLGWPLALVLAGLAIIGVGYYAVKLNKKYLAQQV